MGFSYFNTETNTTVSGRFRWPGTWPFVIAEYVGFPQFYPGGRLDDGPVRNTIFTCPSWVGSEAYQSRPENRRWDRNLLGGYGMNRNMGMGRNIDPDGNWVAQYLHRYGSTGATASATLMFADGSGINGDLGTRFDFNRFGQATFEYLVDPNRHNGGTNLCYLDGSVIFMRESLIVSRGITGALFAE